MNKKVILILVDGMRPDMMIKCGNTFVDELLKTSSYTLKASATFPPVTLPCHMSLIQSVPTERHGIFTNIFTPQSKAIRGLFEVLKDNNLKSMFYYTWEQLKDLSRPQSLAYACFVNQELYKNTDQIITEKSLNNTLPYDFQFLYLGETDEFGHKYGFESDEYLKSISNAFDCIKKVYQSNKDATILVTADHGGHNRDHGQNIWEDMTIPFIAYGATFKVNKILESVNIMDIAPTIASLLCVAPDKNWEGKIIKN